MSLLLPPLSHLSTSFAMKLNAGIITHRLKESKEFYTQLLGFGITFENDWFALLHTPDRSTEISFLLPNLDSQNDLFRPAFPGQGVYFTIEVEDVDAVYARLTALNVPISVELRDEPWGDRHFAITDPNGIGVDIVRYQPAS
jgi:catechol 2,3-dioxygenase-like lactoylglutathione lyase family enzyme